MKFTEERFKEDNRFRNFAIKNKITQKLEPKDISEVPENEREGKQCYYTKEGQTSVINSWNRFNEYF